MERKARAGHVTGGVVFGYRDLYHGEIVWNRTKKRNTQGEREHKWELKRRAEQHWLRVPAPQLKIVTDDLWHSVQSRLGKVRTHALRLSKGQPDAGPPHHVDLGGRLPKDQPVPYLLSGFIRWYVRQWF